MEAYLDNSATTMPCKEAKDEIINALDNIWGNPSSLHQKGMDAEELLEKARKSVFSNTAKKIEVIVRHKVIDNHIQKLKLQKLMGNYDTCRSL